MKLKSIAAILVAGLLVVSVPMVAMADVLPDPGEKVKSSGTYESVTVSDSYAIIDSNGKIDVTVIGDVTNNQTKGSGVQIQSGGSKFDIGGKVTADKNGINNCGGEVTAGSVTATAGTAVFADNSAGPSTTTVKKDVSAQTGLKAEGTGTYVQIDGSAIGVKGQGALVKNSAEVHVAGNATSIENSGVAAITNAVVYVGGDAVSTNEAGAWVESGASVTVSGNAKGKLAGVNATGTGTTVNVTGLVKSTGTNDGDAGINASNGAVVLAGSVDAAKDGVKVSGDSVVVVNGDVDATNCAIYFNNATDKGGMVTVLGKIDGGVHNVAADDVTDKTYSLFVYEVETQNGLKFGEYTETDCDLVKDQVFYIVKTSGVGDIASLTDKNNNQYMTSVDGKTYYGVKSSDAKGNPIAPQSAPMVSEGEGYIVRVTEVPGYKFKSMTTDNAKAVLTMNDDGTYTLIVPAGGGVTLDLIYEAIKSGACFTSTPTSMGSASAPLTGGIWTNVNGAWTYTNNGEKLINTTAWIQYTNAQGQTVTQKFYFDNNGKMITNAWKQTADGVWNYFGADGAMLVNTTTPDGYVVDANGNWVKA